MPQKILDSITHVFHDWDGVYTHYKDFDAFWKTSAEIAVEAGVITCMKKAENEIRELWYKSQKTARPYETAFDVIHFEYGVCHDFCIKRHHEILFQKYGHTFSNVKGVPELLDELPHLTHVVLTHANKYWIENWFTKLGTRHCYDEVICSIEQGLGRKEQDLTLYHALEKRFNVSPEQCILLDDSLPNLKKACEANWNTVWRKKENDTHPYYVDLSYLCVKDFLRDLKRHT